MSGSSQGPDGPTERPPTDSEPTDSAGTASGATFDVLVDRDFESWYRERQFAENIRDGQSYFNGPSPIHPPERHSPSQLLKCHRKLYYQHYNAPEESPAPQGIFWFGSRFEEELAVPYLEENTTSDYFVQNSVWVDFEADVGEHTLHFRGATDPVVVDRGANPVLLTEIKTTSSVDHLNGPKRRHLAQVHAYQRGLREDGTTETDGTTNGNTAGESRDGKDAPEETELLDAVLLYGGRESLDVVNFDVSFDFNFWQNVLNWAAQQTAYRAERTLPPADPEQDWECKYCSFRRRCGKADDVHEDTGAVGLLPRMADYPRERVEEHLQAHGDAKLTPTLAHEYPDLAAEYGVYKWECAACGERIAWDDVDWDSSRSDPPRCPVCPDGERMGYLRGPDPADQYDIEVSSDAA